MEPISVLIVDDSALMRNLIGKIVEANEDLRVVGKAMNGTFALQKIPKLEPDVIVLDLEMPELDGIGFLRERKRLGWDMPVVILSSLARRGAQITMEALALGASDFIMKPSGAVSEDIASVGSQLTEMLRAYGRKYRRRKREREGYPPLRSPAETPSGIRQRPVSIGPERARVPTAGMERRAAETAAPEPRKRIVPQRAPGQLAVIAVGISTGGPNALRDFFSHIDPEIGLPILIVQHMPPGFTAEFARSLDRLCNLEVKEASDGDLLRPGRVLIAPGDRHLVVERRPLATIARITEDPPENGHRPSADVLFASVAKEFGNRALAIIMTGMGRDGAEGIGRIYREGGITLAQDEQSSIVYGMPKVAVESGYIHEVISLPEMAGAVERIVRDNRTAHGG